jgi:hypothetical protein
MNKGMQRDQRKKSEEKSERTLYTKHADECAMKRKLIILFNKTMLINTMLIIFFVY